MSLTVACVLRTGGDFELSHVYALKRSLNRHLPGREFVCLTDARSFPWAHPLRYDWPGWWAKMELCRPDITGPVLYLDLDMVVVGDLSPLVGDPSRSIVLRDLYRGKRNDRALQSALMLLTEADRALVWERWMQGPREWMKKMHGDQNLYERVLADRVEFFQDTHPGLVVGFKSDLRRGGRPLPEEARVVVFHGRPRPWESGVEWAEEPFQ